MKFLYELKDVTLNLNILKTGFLNTTLLVGILIYFKVTVADNLLKSRKNNIIRNIKIVRDQLIETTKSFENKKKQLNQLDILNNKIQYETNLMKKNILKANIDLFKNNLDILFNQYLFKFYSKTQKIHSDLYNKIICLVLEKLKSQFKCRKKEYTNNLVNEIINKFENNHI